MPFRKEQIAFAMNFLVFSHFLMQDQRKQLDPKRHFSLVLSHSRLLCGKNVQTHWNAPTKKVNGDWCGKRGERAKTSLWHLSIYFLVSVPSIFSLPLSHFLRPSPSPSLSFSLSLQLRFFFVKKFAFDIVARRWSSCWHSVLVYSPDRVKEKLRYLLDPRYRKFWSKPFLAWKIPVCH